MRYYARSKNYQSPGGPPVTSAAPAVNPNNTGGPTAYPPPGSGKPAGGNGMRGQPSTQPPPTGAMQGGRRAQPPTPGYQGPNNNVNAGGRAPAATGGGIAGMQHQAAPTTGHSPVPMGAGPTLFLIYNG